MPHPRRITKYAIRKTGTERMEVVSLFLARSGTKNDWVWDIFKASQFHSDPCQFSEIRKIVDSGEGKVVTLRVTAEIIP